MKTEWYIQARKADEDNIVLFETTRYSTLHELMEHVNDMFACITDSVCIWIFKDFQQVGYAQRSFDGFVAVHNVNGEELLLDADN